MANSPDDYEYRKTTLKPAQGTPAPIAVVTVGVPKHQVKPASRGGSNAFRTTVSPHDMHQLRDHLGIAEEAMEEGWQPVPRPAGEPTFKGREGTLFWVERQEL